MDKTIKLGLLAYSYTNMFKSRLKKSEELVLKAMQLTDKKYVAFSGGKDSTVVFDLCQRVNKTVGVFTDETWWYPETEQFIKRLQKEGHDIHWIRTTGTHTPWFQTKPIDAKWVETYAKIQAFGDLTFLGLRKDENGYRRIVLNKYGKLFYAKSKDAWLCNPIGDWTARDVWAYIFSRGIDYNKVYDKLSEIGIPLDKQRVGPLAEERALWAGQMAVLKRGWPDLYERFATEYPEARMHL